MNQGLELREGVAMAEVDSATGDFFFHEFVEQGIMPRLLEDLKTGADELTALA